MGVIDISNPASPSFVGKVTDSNFSATGGLAVRGKYVYSGDGERLFVVDISNPSIPKVVFKYVFSRVLTDIAVSGNYLYSVSVSLESLDVFDISNPSSPVFVGSTGSAGTSLSGAVRSYVSGGYAYVGVTEGNKRLTVVDISNPRNPVVKTSLSISTLNNPRGLVVSGRYAYIKDDGAGALVIVDISNPLNPKVVGTKVDTTNLLGTGTVTTNRLALSGRRIITTAPNTNKLTVWDAPGADVPLLSTGDIETSNLKVWDTTDIGNWLNVRGGLNVGINGIQTDGRLSVTVASLSLTVASVSLEPLFTIKHDKGFLAGDAIVVNVAANTTANYFTGNFGRFQIAGTDRIILESSGAILASGAAQFGSAGVPSSVSYSRFGTNSTTHSGSITASNDLLISGDLEVDGSAYFDGTVNFGGIASAQYFYAQTGTAASPSFSFNIDQDTGMFRPTTNQLAFSTFGVERLRIDSSGNVGINSGGNVDTKLEVGGTASISGNTTIYGTLSVPGTGASSERFGASTTAGGNNSLAVGNGASSAGLQALSIGSLSTAGGENAISIGMGTSSSGSRAISIGNASFVTSTSGIALGTVANVSGGNSIAIGDIAEAAGTTAIALGYNSSANTLNGIAIGQTSATNGGAGLNGQIAIGVSTISNSNFSIAIGAVARTTAANQLVIGSPTGAINDI